VKRTLFLVATFISVSALQASTVITCSEVAMATNTCSAAHITDFNANLQWNAVGSANGISFTNTISGNAGTNVVSAGAFGGNMMFADNYGMIADGFGGWINPVVLPSAPFQFTGRFDASPDVAPAGFAPVGNPGDHLLGVYHNNSSLLLGFSQAIPEFAFRISANSLSTFGLTLTYYASSDGTGPALGTSTFASLTGGGNCAGLIATPPVPCNDAPWVVGSGFTSNIGSIVIHTGDTSGFFIDTLYLNNPSDVPEPGTTTLIGLGLISVGLVARYRRQRV
jgi:hypothetical protein